MFLTRSGRPMIGRLLLLIVVTWMVGNGLMAAFGYTGTPEVKRYNEGKKTAVVFFTGVQSSGDTHSAAHREQWSKHGDVVVVEYNREKSDSDKISSETHERLVGWGYKQIYLIGGSDGGLLATDLIDYDRNHDSKLEFLAVFMADVPVSAADLYDRYLAWVSVAWWPGPFDNKLLTKPFWGFNFKPPTRDEIGKGVDDKLLEEHYHASSTYPLSGYASEVRHIVMHRDFKDGEYKGIKLVVLQSENDSVVKKQAAEKWLKIFGNGKIVPIKHSTHVGFIEWPQEWTTGFNQAFELAA